VLGFAAMELLGLLALAGVARLGAGEARFALPEPAAFGVALALGLLATYAIGRSLGLLGAPEVDHYREGLAAVRPPREAPTRARSRPQGVPRVRIEY
jgi:hypothetical protein